MPSNYLNRLHADYGIPMKKLEDYWSRAVEIAEKSGHKEQYAYVTGIFKNMLALTSSSSDFWDMLTLEQKKAYLAEHPNSHFQLPTDGAPDPSEETDNTPKHNLRRKLHSKWSRGRAGAVSTLRHHRTGLGFLKSFLSGGTLTDSEYEQAQKTAKVAAGLILFALVGVALFTPLAPLVGPLGAAFLNSESSEEALPDTGDDAEELAGEVLDAMYDWLLEQDIPALVKKLKSEEA